MAILGLSPTEEKSYKRMQEKMRKAARHEATFWKEVDKREDEVVAHYAEKHKRAASQAEQHVNTGSTTGYQRQNAERNEQ